MDDLAALWQYASSFLNSNAFTAISDSCAGAFAGAWVAQLIAARGKAKDDFLAERRNTSAATVVALSICNSFLSIKKQHVKRLKDTFGQPICFPWALARLLPSAVRVRIAEVQPLLG